MSLKPALGYECRVNQIVRVTAQARVVSRKIYSVGLLLWQSTSEGYKGVCNNIRDKENPMSIRVNYMWQIIYTINNHERGVHFLSENKIWAKILAQCKVIEQMQWKHFSLKFLQWFLILVDITWKGRWRVSWGRRWTVNNTFFKSNNVPSKRPSGERSKMRM